MTTTAQGILSGNEILQQIEKGNIKISPFDRGRINPASYDLTLGREVAVHKAVVSGDFRRLPNHFTGYKGIPGERLQPKYVTVAEFVPGVNCIDVKQPVEVLRYEMDDDGLLLKPGIGYLMHTHERIWTGQYEPIVDGKSTIGRLFVKVHETAGFGDPDFDDQYTLEVTAVHPIIVYPGMRFCQIRFHTIIGEVTPYAGNYVPPSKDGPGSGVVPSRAHRMFQAG